MINIIEKDGATIITIENPTSDEMKIVSEAKRIKDAPVAKKASGWSKKTSTDNKKTEKTKSGWGGSKPAQSAPVKKSGWGKPKTSQPTVQPSTENLDFGDLNSDEWITILDDADLPF